jgi:hypothetical protein
LALLDRELDARPEPRRILVHYVPHAFGWKAVNVPFCIWLQRRRRDSVWVMFHEVAYPIACRQSLRRNVLGLATRAMAGIVARAAERAFVSIPAWEPLIRASTHARVTWLPVPSTIAIVADPSGVANIRARYGGGRPLVGHFGTYGDLTRPLLFDALDQLFRLVECRVLLLGKRSEQVAAEFVAGQPDLAGCVRGTGALHADDVSRHVSACDVMMQPYPDGVSSRRTSVMVALSHSRAVATTHGALTESVWLQSQAVALAPAGDGAALASAAARLLTDAARTASFAAAARRLYDDVFDLRHTIRGLRSEWTERASLEAAS